MQDESLDTTIKKCFCALPKCQWIRDEFDHDIFGDLRIFKRFLVVAKHLSNQPAAYINQAHGEWNKTKAAYRFFDNERVEGCKIMKAHRDKTIKRMAQQTEVVLIIQDTSFLNFSHMKQSNDLGPIGELKSSSMGLVMHSSLAVSFSGLPLGFADHSLWARKIEDYGKSKYCDDLPIEQKESFKWIKALRNYVHLIPSNCKAITVGDRESDIYDFLVESNKLGAYFLVRAKNDRVVGDSNLWAFMEQQAVAGSYCVEVPESNKHPKRTAKLEFRYSKVTMKPTKRRSNLNDITLWAVYAKEVDCHNSVEPLDWMLLTNSKIETPQEAMQALDWYKKRWQIEVFHKILKSGCAVEMSRLEINQRRFPLIAMKSIIAWKIFQMTFLHRISPEQPATTILSQAECFALYCMMNKQPTNEISKLSARKATRWLAQLGGFLGRASDKEPGPELVWRGWQRLQDFTQAFHVAFNMTNQHNR